MIPPIQHVDGLVYNTIRRKEKLMKKRSTFKKRFIWGKWGWGTLLFKKDRVVVGKLKVLTAQKPIRHRSKRRR